MERDTEILAVSKALKGVIFEIAAANEAAVRSQNLKDTDYRCLMFLVETGGQSSPKDLIQHLGVTSGAVTGILDRLERQGYLARSPNPDDRRGTLVTLDARKGAGFVTAFSAMQSGFDDCIRDMTAQDLKTVSRFLDYIATLARQAKQSIEQEG
nr:MarR family transcriptional regulator [uncultured Cohaesibacter sp.]